MEYNTIHNLYSKKLEDLGYNGHEVYEALHHTRSIGYRVHNLLSDKEHDKYCINIIDNLINGKITLDEIRAEYQPLKDAKEKHDKEKRAKEKAEYERSQQELLEKHQQEQLQELQNALRIIGIIGKKCEPSKIDDYIKRMVIKVKWGTLLRHEVLEYAEYLKQEETLRKIEERRQQDELLNKEYQAQQEKEDKAEKEYKELAAKGQFEFDGLLIQRQKYSTSFLLPNENNEEVTAYNIIERLAGDAFKAYAKQIKFKNDKIQILPYSERIRIIYYFRNQYKNPPLLDNAETIAFFINTANKYTNNRELKQNWSACLNVTADYTENPKQAASLLVYYGWAAGHKEIPRTENAFYTVDVKNGERHYNIVNDDITLRFEEIEQHGRVEAYEIITNKELSDKDKYNKLHSILQPKLWWRKNVKIEMELDKQIITTEMIKMGLTKDAYYLCNNRISEYINNLLSHNAFDGISLEEHINNVKINKSETGLIFAEPRQFVISMDDIEFCDYKYNITAEYNKENAAALGAARSKKAADKNFSDVVGNEWTTQELYAQGIDKDKIPRLIDNGKIERVKRGVYRRL